MIAHVCDYSLLIWWFVPYAICSLCRHGLRTICQIDGLQLSATPETARLPSTQLNADQHVSQYLPRGEWHATHTHLYFFGEDS